MKRIIIRSCVTALFISLLDICGAGEPGKNKQVATAAEQKPPADKTGSVKESGVLTGSLLKSTYNRRGHITDGHSQVVVLDSRTIENSGAADLRELLTRKGLHR
jgi:hypothetical protein